MLKALNIKIYPNNEQKIYLGKLFGCYRKVYNLCLDKSILEYENGNNCTNLAQFSNYFHRELLKTDDYSYLKEHNTKILKDGINNLSVAFSNFFKKIQKDTGYPNYKKRSNEQSVGLQKEAISRKVLETKDRLFISKHFGLIKYKTSPEYKKYLEKYKNSVIRITIKKTKSDEYYARILIDSDEIKQLPKPKNKIIGLDLGIKQFIYTSKDEQYENLRLNKKYSKRIKHLQRQLDKKKLTKTGEFKFNKKYNKDVEIKTPSKNREKARIKLAKVFNKINNIKENYLHNVVNKLLNDNQIIVIEDLNVKGMMKNHKLAGAIQDVNFGEFKTMLTYKCNWYGRELIKIDRWFPSSKLCSCCGNKKDKLKLSERIYKCDNCGLEIDRDLNASINIEREGLRILRERENI